MKVPLAMNLDVNEEGMIRPKYFVWPDNGKAYFVDRVLDVCRAAALKAGGAGTRYRCRVCGKVVDIFCDEGKWLMRSRIHLIRVIKIRSAKLRIAGGLPIKIPRAKLRIARGGCR